MNALTQFLLGSWSGVGLLACLVVTPTALLTDADPVSVIVPTLILCTVRILERGMNRSPLEILRYGK